MQCCAVYSSNEFYQNFPTNFNWDLECSKCVLIKLANEIQLHYHVCEYHWLMSIKDLHWSLLECSNSVPNIPIAHHCVYSTLKSKRVDHMIFQTFEHCITFSKISHVAQKVQLLNDLFYRTIQNTFFIIFISYFLLWTFINIKISFIF